MKHFKISDGDLIVITWGEGIYESRVQKMCEAVHEWTKKRGLEQVEVLTFRTAVKEEGVEISVLTVNDIFEREVLQK